MHVNAPPSVTQVKVVSTPPLTVTRVSAPENPLPLALTVSPTTPEAGDNVRLGTVTVNIAIAVSPAPPRLPTAVIV